MKNTIIKFLGVFVLILGFGLIFNVNADANKSSLADVLEFQHTYKKSGSIKHGVKTYNFWTLTDERTLDGKERKIVAISVYEKNSGKTIEQYYINYYQNGLVGYVKLFNATNHAEGQWLIEKNPEDIHWYSERLYFWIKNKDGKDWSIGKWKARNTKEWLYGVSTLDPDTNKNSWESWGTSLKDIKSNTNLPKAETKKLFLKAKKEAREAKNIENLLSKLEKKYYAKIIKEDSTKIVKKTDKEEVPKEQKAIEEKLETVLEELAKIKKELKKNKESDTPKITTDEKYYALVIGNNNYQYLEKLDAAENDAKVLAHVLKNNYGFEVKLLLNADYDTTVNSIHKISKRVKKDENLLIFYAGHGELDKKQNRGYWLPIDASYDQRSKWISNAIVADELKATDAKHVLLIVDSCFSGSLMRSANQTYSNQKLDDEKYIKKLQKKKTRLVITSGGNEPVMDNDGGDHSLFAQKLIDTLKENKGVINTEIIFQNIRRYVAQNADQMPEKGAIYKAGHDGGDFLFFSNLNLKGAN